jgi:serine/threonine protein kinase
MGEVYRARDTRLDRTVAIKILPPAARGDDARRRLEQEGRTISRLKHPTSARSTTSARTVTSIFW